MQKRKEKSKEEELVLENFLSAYLVFKNSFLFLKDFHDDLLNIVPCLVRVLKCYFKKREIWWLADQVIKDIGLSTCLSVFLPVYLTVYLSFGLSVCLSVCQSECLLCWINLWTSTKWRFHWRICEAFVRRAIKFWMTLWMNCSFKINFYSRVYDYVSSWRKKIIFRLFLALIKEEFFHFLLVILQNVANLIYLKK